MSTTTPSPCCSRSRNGTNGFVPASRTGPRSGSPAKGVGAAETFSRVLGQPFTYEPRPPEEFLQKVLAAGSEPAYMRCVYNSYVWLTAGKDIGADEIFDNFPAITGRQPRTLADFAKTHAATFQY